MVDRAVALPLNHFEKWISVIDCLWANCLVEWARALVAGVAARELDRRS